MNIFTNSGKTKKFILILVMLLLFNFCFPKIVKAAEDLSWWEELLEHIKALPGRLFWWIEEGLLVLLNDIFSDNDALAGTTHNTSGGTNYTLYFTPENIIKGKYLIFDANIFRVIDPSENRYYDDGNAWLVEGRTGLRETVAGWYYAVRNLTIVGLLTVLVYVGIRMIISTIAQDKAKYKVMFKDWLVALCLVVLMHYMMITILEITSKVTEAIGGSSNSNMVTKYMGELESILEDTLDEDEDGIDDVYQYNGMGLKDAYVRVVIMIFIIVFTVIFAVKYLKREFTVLFLILLGPISCITYPIDKISDGKAQAFNKWFTEFMYQVIIQPFHLLLYVVLIGTATTLADNNILYALVCFGVLIPAEKFVKEMFGIQAKLGSPVGSFAAGAMASKLMSALASKGRGGSSKGAVGKGEDGEDSNYPIPQRNHNKPAVGAEESGNRIERGNAPQASQVEQPERQHRLEQGGQDGGEVQLDNQNQVGQDPSDLNAAEEKPAITENYDSDYDMGGNNDKTETSQYGNDPYTFNTAEEADKLEQTSTGGHIEQGAEPQPQPQPQQQPQQETYTSKTKRDGLVRRAINTHNLRVSKKYGTDSRGKRWRKRGGKALKALARGAGRTAVNAGGRVLKSAAVAAVALPTAAVALASGNGKEALATITGAAGFAAKNAVGLAKDVGKDAIGGGKKAIKNAAKGSLKDYTNAFRKEEGKRNWRNILKGEEGETRLGNILKSKEEKAFENYAKDPKVMKAAEQGYMKNHNGETPSATALMQEVRDRFSLAREGMTEEQIDKALPLYQEKNMEQLEKQAEDSNINVDELKQQAGGPQNLNQEKYRKLLEDNLGDEKVATAAEIAGGKTKSAQKFAPFYKEADYLNEGKVSEMHEGLVKKLKAKRTFGRRCR